MAEEAMGQAEEATHSCSYCDSQHTQLEFALHKVSNTHVKKVQKRLFQRGFSSVCLVCNSALKDLNHVELHVQEKKHSERMRSCLVNSFLSTDKCTCGSCGITFFNEVVLEAHYLLPLHDSTESPPNTPKLNEICKELSGLSGAQLLAKGNRLCNVCNVILDGVEELVMHLFTPPHIARLRSSSCILCKKDFMHASDREAHLKSSKHSLTMSKCSNLLEAGDTQSLLRKGGFPCMYCMIWCNSWLCLEIHILDMHHAKVSAQSKANFPKIIFLAGAEGSGATSSCNESAMSNWKEWRGDALEERIWCHRCGVTLLGINEANRHLDTHGTERCRATGELHSINVLGLSQLPQIYDCSVCAMSFKSAFMLSAHTACLEHHKKLAGFSSTDTVYCCSSCGLLTKSDLDGNGPFVWKDLKGSSLTVKDAEAVSRCLKLPNIHLTGCNVVSKDRSVGVTSFSNGTHQSPDLVATNENIIEGNGVHICHGEANSLFIASGSNQGYDKANLLDVEVMPGPGQDIVSRAKTNVLTECAPTMNQTLHTLSNSSDNCVNGESGGFGCSKNLGHVSAKVVDGHGMFAGQICRNVTAVGNSTEPSKNSLHLDALVADGGANSLQAQSQLPPAFAALDDILLRQNKGTILVNDACLADLGFPVVVAATLAPLRNLQESLQSITAVVTEALSSAVHNLYVQQSTKRKSQHDVGGTVDTTHAKRLCAERTLEAALQQGLRSVSSNTTKLENVDCKLQNRAEEDMVRHSSTGDGEEQLELRAVIAVAASVTPSGFLDLSRPVNNQGQAAATKVQESSAMQIVDNTSKQAQDSADVKNESLSHGVVGSQAAAETTLAEKVVDEKQAQVETSHLQPDVALACRNAQNNIQSFALVPLTKDAVKDEGSLQARTPIAPHVNAASHNSKSESNDDDDSDEDDYSFLDPRQGAWWVPSDSDDSDSM